MAASNEGGTDVYEPSEEIRRNAHISSMDEYRKMHKKSVEDPDAFWGDIAKDFYWKSPPTGEFLKYNFDISKGPISIKWMPGATTNMCYNTLDRNIERGLGDNVAYYWEGNDSADFHKITYKELQQQVCKFANVLKNKGVKKGDCVAMYMPMIPEIVIAMLACVRIGAIHSIVFGGYSSESLAERILDADCCILITADAVWRGTKLITLKDMADKALEICAQKGHILKTTVVAKHLGPKSMENDCNATRIPGKRPVPDLQISWNPDADVWWHDEMAKVSDTCEPEWVDAEHSLFILYTSGSTGKPKGVLHTTGGYMLYAATTFKYIFDYHSGEVYFCTADIGWITGHTYVTYGPLLNGATSVMFEGLPTHPHPARYWEVVDKYKVNIFYTAPTAIRALMKFGESHVKKFSRKTLRLLGSVGEPINPEAWLWYHRVVGNGKCAIVDTFWQTETGGIVITPLPGCTPLKPGSATFPFFGVIATLLNEDGKEIKGPGEGFLVFKQPWPGLMRTVYANHHRFETTYFSKFPGYYCTGDGARRDKDGYLWITGRIDDMLNVSGHLLSTAAVESALISHKSVAETAAVSHPHPIKGECLYCFIVLKEGQVFSVQMAKELKEKVRYWIGPFAVPEYLHIASSLPKTRSGKIMRRVLRKIAANDRNVGDITTLVDESIIDELFKTRPKTLS